MTIHNGYEFYLFTLDIRDAPNISSILLALPSPPLDAVDPSLQRQNARSTKAAVSMITSMGNPRTKRALNSENYGGMKGLWITNNRTGGMVECSWIDGDCYWICWECWATLRVEELQLDERPPFFVVCKPDRLWRYARESVSKWFKTVFALQFLTKMCMKHCKTIWPKKTITDSCNVLNQNPGAC